MSDAFATLAAVRAPDQAALLASAQASLAMATNYEIPDDGAYSLAGEELKAIKAKAKRLEEQRTAITVPINTALKAVNDLFAQPKLLLAQAEALVKGAMITYSDKQAAIAKAARDLAEAEIRRAAEEADRLAAEAAQAARLAAAEGAPKEAVEQAAQAAEAAADRALEVQMVASNSIAQFIPAPKAAGISKVRETFKARVIDKEALVRHALTDPAVLALLEVDTGKLNQLARALGTSLNYPGVEVYTERSISARAE